MTRIKTRAFLFLLIASVQAPLANAGLITLNEHDSGNILRFGTSYSNSSGFDNIESGAASCGILCFVSWQDMGYLIFDLSGVTGLVTSASITLDIDPQFGLGSIEVYDYTWNSVSYLENLPDGPINATNGAALHDDFSSGNLFASLEVDAGTGPGAYNLQLSNTALNLINGATGLIAMGLSWSISGDPFADIDVAGPSLLNLTVNQGASVPVPGTLWLLALAGILLRRSR